MKGMTQEIGKLKAAKGEIDYSKYPLGSRLYLYPWHVSVNNSYLNYFAQAFV